MDLEQLLDAGQFARAEVLARQLPAQSRTVERIEPRAAWDEHAYLLALVADNLSFLRYEQAGGRGKRPKPIERPKPRRVESKRLDVGDARVDELLFGKR